MEAAADRVERELGPIDIWVNDAMTSVFAPIKEMTAEEFRRVTEVTYLGYVYGTLAALKHMLPRDRGTIVQVGSALAYRSIPLQAAYCASKHAVLGFFAALRTELLHDHSKVQTTMVQMPALNTPQFGWVREQAAAQGAAGAADFSAGSGGARGLLRRASSWASRVLRGRINGEGDLRQQAGALVRRSLPGAQRVRGAAARRSRPIRTDRTIFTNPWRAITARTVRSISVPRETAGSSGRSRM